MRVPHRFNDLFIRTLLCEFTSYGPGGPVPTPMQHTWLPERGIFVLASPLGVRFKIDRIRREPRVCLSLTDFTGSGLRDPDRVLVQGRATLTHPAAGVAGLEDFWRTNLRKKPDQRVAAFETTIRADDRRLFYLRARFEVEPSRIRVMHGPPGNQRMEVVTL